MADITIEREYYPAIFVARVINVIVGIIEIALALRVILELLGANAASAFVAWVYGVTAGLLGPFAGAFASVNIGSGAVIDVVAILAMIAYAVIGWLIVEVLSAIFVSTSRLP